MIVFTCQCGKKYRLPDRNAGRVVRCNQCEQSITVPMQSQEEPVVPDALVAASDSGADAVRDDAPLGLEPLGLAVEPEEKPKPAATATTPQPVPSPQPTAPVAAQQPRQTAVPIAAHQPPQGSQQNPFGTATASQNPPQGSQQNPFGTATAPQNPPQGSQQNPFGAATASQNPLQGSQQNPFGTATAPGAVPVDPFAAATAAAPAVAPAAPAPAAAPTTAAPFAIQPRASSVSGGGSGSPQLYLGLFAGSIAAGIALGLLAAGLFVTISASKPATTPGDASDTAVDAGGMPVVQGVSAATLGQILTARDPQRFAPLSTGATQVQIAADTNPIKPRTGTDAVVDELEVSLSDGPTSREPHQASLRIEATGTDPFGVTRAVGESGDCELEQLSEVRFCIYMPESANKAFEPKSIGEPPAPFELSGLSVRLGQGTEYVQLEPKEFAAFATRYARMRQGWIDLVVPLQGDDTWKRSGSKTAPEQAQWIELRLAPSGKGVTLWIDNLKIVGKE